MATNEVLLGNGVKSVLPDLTRRKVQKRKPRIKRRHGFVRLIDPRRTSVVFVGAQATALVLGRSGMTTIVRGTVDLRGVAAAVWDIAPTGTPMMWGRRNPQDAKSIESYSIDSLGNLYFHSVESMDAIGVKIRRNNWFMTGTALSGGQLILAHQDRSDLMDKALKRGVEVNPQAWSTLLASSRKYLVPE